MSNSKKKSINSFSGLVYSTNPDAIPSHDDTDEIVTLTPENQKLKVLIDRKHRKGKTVTLVLGFEGRENDLEELAKKLKTKCGTGGNAKDGEIVIQGEVVEKVKQFLIEWGYTKTK